MTDKDRAEYSGTTKNISHDIIESGLISKAESRDERIQQLDKIRQLVEPHVQHQQHQIDELKADNDILRKAQSTDTETLLRLCDDKNKLQAQLTEAQEVVRRVQACRYIDMGDWYEIPVDEWEDVLLSLQAIANTDKGKDDV